MNNIMISLAVLVVVMATITTSSAAICKRGIQICNVTDEATGQFTLTEYGCSQMCCGGKLYDRDQYLQCCGNNDRGIPFNSNTQMCCMWQFGNEYVIHNKTQGGWCCGSELFDPAANPGQSCCNSWQNRPAIFSSATEMCCAGQVQFAGDTAYTSCCGSISFDRRVASCPCHDSQVVLIPENFAGCCQHSDGTKTAYNIETQGCCNGLAYDNSLQFCCGGLVGEVGTEVCCGNSIASKTANQTGTACCLLADGSQEVYDDTQQVCCGGAVLDNIGNDRNSQICCNGNLFDTATAGDACCNDVPYFSSDSVCCAGEIQLGDRCCDNVGYNSLNQLCCGGVVSANLGDSCCENVAYNSLNQSCCGGVVGSEFGDSCCENVAYNSLNQLCCGGVVGAKPSTYTYPSCCVNTTFDSYVQTCCGGVVYNNPEIISILTGTTEVSHTTRCCGDFSDDRTLFPYDYTTSTCCEGNIVDLGGMDQSLAQCCGAEAINTEVSTCCDGSVVVDKWYGEATGCCNGSAMNTTDSICCGGNIFPKNETECCGTTGMDSSLFRCCNDVPRSLNGVPADKAICCGENVIPKNETMECCGTTGMDSSLFKCCNGVPRSLNGVPAEKAICCGQGCIDGEKYFCCDGQQYEKGNPVGVDVSGLTCDALFP